MNKRIMSLFLVVVMVLSLLSVRASAKEAFPVLDSGKGSVPSTGDSVATESIAGEPAVTKNSLSVSVDKVTDSGAVLTFNGSMSGNVYYLVRQSDQTTPDEEAVLAGATVTVASGSAITTQLTELTAETDYTAYGLLEFVDGSYSAIASVAFTTKATTPMLRSGTLEASVDTSYKDEHGVEHTVSATVVTSTTTTLTNGWYVVNSDVNMIGRTVVMNGDVHLILADGGSLAADGLDSAFDGSLTIYGQTAGSGELIARSCGIICENVTINGGIISSTNINVGMDGVGIGRMNNCTVTINGGTVNATSKNSAGIGSVNNGTVTINGGTVNATSITGKSIWGITITITGGSVYANKLSVPPTGAGGKTVQSTSITLENVSAVTQITSMTISGVSTIPTDVYTDKYGWLYLWLPSGAEVTGITTGGLSYTGSVSAGSSGMLAWVDNMPPTAVSVTPSGADAAISGTIVITFRSYERLCERNSFS